MAGTFVSVRSLKDKSTEGGEASVSPENTLQGRSWFERTAEQANARESTPIYDHLAEEHPGVMEFLDSPNEFTVEGWPYGNEFDTAEGAVAEVEYCDPRVQGDVCYKSEDEKMSETYEGRAIISTGSDGEFDLDFEVPEVAEEFIEEWLEDCAMDQIVLVYGFAAKLWEVLTEEQKALLSPPQRAALRKIHENADEVAISDEVANKITV